MIRSWPNSSSQHPTSLSLSSKPTSGWQHCTPWPDVHGAHFCHLYCITPESLWSALRALGFDLNSSSARCFFNKSLQNTSLQQPTPQAAAVTGGKTKGGYSIPITCIWKWETLTIPDHPGNLVAEQETKPRPHVPPKQHFPRTQSRNFLPCYQVLTGTSAWLCYGDRVGGIPQMGTGLWKAEAMTVDSHCSFTCGTISFQAKTSVTASSTVAYGASTAFKAMPVVVRRRKWIILLLY